MIFKKCINFKIQKKNNNNNNNNNNTIFIFYFILYYRFPIWLSYYMV